MQLCRAYKSKVEKFASDLVQPMTPTLVLSASLSSRVQYHRLARWREVFSGHRTSILSGFVASEITVRTIVNLSVSRSVRLCLAAPVPNPESFQLPTAGLSTMVDR